MAPIVNLGRCGNYWHLPQIGFLVRCERTPVVNAKLQDTQVNKCDQGYLI